MPASGDVMNRNEVHAFFSEPKTVKQFAEACGIPLGKARRRILRFHTFQKRHTTPPTWQSPGHRVTRKASPADLCGYALDARRDILSRPVTLGGWVTSASLYGPLRINGNQLAAAVRMCPDLLESTVMDGKRYVRVVG